MSKTTNPLDLWANGAELARIGLEANAVIAMRLMGMMGLWKVRDSEFVTMFTEKPTAFAEAWFEAYRVAMTGAAPEKVLAASMVPISKATKANHKRLTRSGPSF